MRNNINVNQNSFCVIHLAGIAHDLSNKYEQKDYNEINFKLTKKIFKKFLKSNNKIFIFLSSIKSVGDYNDKKITEKTKANPSSHYGISKLKAEKYILKKINYKLKKVYILRPSMIYGNSKKGNLYMLYNFIKKGLPWPFILFNNKRSYLSISNLNFVINELITNKYIKSGIYNVCDSEYLSTNQIVEIIKNETKSISLNIPISKKIIIKLFKVLDILNSKYNMKMLNKIIGNCIVDNSKLIKAINKKLPYNSKNEMRKTIRNFKKC